MNEKSNEHHRGIHPFRDIWKGLKEAFEPLIGNVRREINGTVDLLKRANVQRKEGVVPVERECPQTELDVGHVLDDLYNVGPTKPIGYLPVKTIEIAGETVESVVEKITQKGLRHKLVKKHWHHSKGGALYVFDEKALQELLFEHADVLEKTKWPAAADEFVEKVATKNVRRGTELYNLIALAFDSPENISEIEPGRESEFRRIIRLIREAYSSTLEDIKRIRSSQNKK